MQIQTWFAIFTVEDEAIIRTELFPKDLPFILERFIERKTLLMGNVAGRDLSDLALTYGFADSKEEYDSLLHKFSILLAKEQIDLKMTPEKRIIAAVEAIDGLNETQNILSERLKEWYIMNFENTLLTGEELAKKVLLMENNDRSYLKIMQDFSSNLLELNNTRRSIEEYVRENMQHIAPNLNNIAGHILGARLLSIAGSLERLASMPSSTIQVIGANNALFKHLKGNATSPKHGIIFRHPFINRAPKWQRGKIARALASKISLAARYDFYSGDLKEDLSVGLRAKVEAIRKKHPVILSNRDSQALN